MSTSFSCTPLSPTGYNSVAFWTQPAFTFKSLQRNQVSFFAQSYDVLLLQTSGESFCLVISSKMKCFHPIWLLQQISYLEAIYSLGSLPFKYFWSTRTPLCFFFFNVYEGVIVFLFLQSSEFQGYLLPFLLQSTSVPRWQIIKYFPTHFLPRPWSTQKAAMGQEQLFFH